MCSITRKTKQKLDWNILFPREKFAANQLNVNKRLARNETNASQNMENQVQTRIFLNTTLTITIINFIVFDFFDFRFLFLKNDKYIPMLKCTAICLILVVLT